MKDIFTSKKCEWVFSNDNQVWQTRLKQRVPEKKEHIWMLSSGTGRANAVKAIAHRKQGFLCAAGAANHHLQSTNKDTWFNVLPTYHVGGLAIFARAFLSGAKVIQPRWRKWDAEDYVRQVSRTKATLSSLVPTQVFDIVTTNLPAPASLRAIVVGGGALDPALYKKARGLGWPLLPSYGLTECASQVATAALESLDGEEFPFLKPLEHVRLRLKNHHLQIASEAVCEWVSTIHASGLFTLENPAPQGWLQTDDRVELSNSGMKMLGRQGDLVKVLGVLVNTNDVEQRIREKAAEIGLSGRVAVAVAQDPRRENVLILITDSKDSVVEWVKLKDKFNQSLQGPERIEQVYWVEKIPQTALHKTKKIELLKLLLGF